MGTYATVADVNDYIAGGSGIADPDLEKIITQAERDIDAASGYRGPEATLIFTPADLGTVRADALSRATAAQVEYRLTKGEQFFIEQASPEQGKRAEPRVGPKAIAELQAAGLRLVTGRMA